MWKLKFKSSIVMKITSEITWISQEELPNSNIITIMIMMNFNFNFGFHFVILFRSFLTKWLSLFDFDLQESKYILYKYVPYIFADAIIFTLKSKNLHTLRETLGKSHLRLFQHHHHTTIDLWHFVCMFLSHCANFSGFWLLAMCH